MTHRRLTMLTATIAGTLLLATAQAADPEELIKYRQNVMRILGSHTSAGSAIIRGQVDHADHLRVHAEGLAATAPLISTLFPPESAEGETDALPGIWEEPETFASKVEQAEAAIADFSAAVAEGGDVAAALRDMGAACRSCHDDYRVSQ